MGTILLVANRKTTADALRRVLYQDGHEVIWAQTRRQVLRQVRVACPDVVLVDTTSARLSGQHIWHAIRQMSEVPIVAIVRPQDDGRPDGDGSTSEINADVQLVKPYSADALSQALHDMCTKPLVIEIGEVRLDLRTRRVWGANGAEHLLRPKEFGILRLLMRNAGRTVTRLEIMREVWETDYVGDTRTLDVHIRWIRKKVERDPSKPVYIVTIRGQGYRFVTPEEFAEHPAQEGL
ncbi:MAG: response regulator transcription factor [Ardenticatenia bacterium]|nr:response regulator transcription factor [Ardenticatenia bacterium]